MLFYGLLFALLRWRSRGIIGLILVHGAMDFSALLLLPDLDVLALGRPAIRSEFALAAGLLMIAAIPFYLWFVHPTLYKHK